MARTKKPPLNKFNAGDTVKLHPLLKIKAFQAFNLLMELSELHPVEIGNTIFNFHSSVADLFNYLSNITSLNPKVGELLTILTGIIDMLNASNLYYGISSSIISLANILSIESINITKLAPTKSKKAGQGIYYFTYTASSNWIDRIDLEAYIRCLKLLNSVGTFYRNLPLVSDSEQVLNYLKSLNPTAVYLGNEIQDSILAPLNVPDTIEKVLIEI